MFSERDFQLSYSICNGIHIKRDSPLTQTICEVIMVVIFGNGTMGKDECMLCPSFILSP